MGYNEEILEEETKIEDLSLELYRGRENRKLKNIMEQPYKPQKSIKIQKVARRKWTLASKYGLTVDSYNEMKRQQNDQCPICEKNLGESDREDPVDHDHKTGRIRGILCSRCNMRLGWYEKNKKNIKVYLKG